MIRCLLKPDSSSDLYTPISSVKISPAKLSSNVNFLVLRIVSDISILSCNNESSERTFHTFNAYCLSLHSSLISKS